MTSLRTQGRIAGLWYLALVVFPGPIRLLYIPSKLFVEGNAAATAANIAAHESLFRFGMAATVVSAVIFLFLGLALYRLLRKVSESQASVMVIFVIIAVVIDCVNVLNDAAVLLLLRGSDLVSVFDKPHREALAMFFLDLHGQNYVINETFWGLWLIPLGWMVIRSRFLPRLLGVWLFAAGLGWIAVSMTGLMVPQYADLVFRITHPIRLGEVAFLLWLVIMGAKQRAVAPQGHVTVDKSP